MALKKVRTKRTGERMTNIGLSIPAKLRERMEREAPATNWSALVTRAIEIELDRGYVVQQSILIRLAELEARVNAMTGH